jgi:uncharacterized membrane protein YciS (DUF1049 family)
MIALFAAENMKAWTTPVSFNLDLWILGKAEWNLQLYLVAVISAGIGLLIGIILMLKPYFRVRKTLARVRKEKKDAAQAETVTAKDTEAQAVQG